MTPITADKQRGGGASTSDAAAVGTRTAIWQDQYNAPDGKGWDGRQGFATACEEWPDACEQSGPVRPK